MKTILLVILSLAISACSETLSETATDSVSPTDSADVTIEQDVIMDTTQTPTDNLFESMSENDEMVDTVLSPLPQRSGPRPTTTGSVPHQQIGVEPVTELNATLHRWVSSLPNVEMPNAIASLPGATGIWLTEGTFIAQPQVMLAGREFSHIHPDGSLHAPLPLARALEAVEMGWAEHHPWAEQREGWDGLVMLYTPQSEFELEIVFQLTVESYNFVTGQNEVTKFR